jgi:hypothetical protein
MHTSYRFLSATAPPRFVQLKYGVPYCLNPHLAFFLLFLLFFVFLLLTFFSNLNQLVLLTSGLPVKVLLHPHSHLHQPTHPPSTIPSAPTTLPSSISISFFSSFFRSVFKSGFSFDRRVS